MELGPEAVMVIHVGGLTVTSQRDRPLVPNLGNAAGRVQARLVLEHDDLRYSAADVLAIHQRTGVRLIFDLQHFWCLNPEGLELKPTLEKYLRTWPQTFARRSTFPRLAQRCAK